MESICSQCLIPRLVQLCACELCIGIWLCQCFRRDELGQGQCWRKLHDDKVSAQRAVGVWRGSRDTKQ